MGDYPFDVGIYARRAGRPFLSNPYERGTASWKQWRNGWLEEDATLRGVDKSTVEDDED